jgi:hypothetical protein
MQDKKSAHHMDDYAYNHENNLKHWRAWGSWFSWGSPTGLSLFFISVAATLWILSQAFGWK